MKLKKKIRYEMNHRATDWVHHILCIYLWKVFVDTQLSPQGCAGDMVWGHV